MLIILLVLLPSVVVCVYGVIAVLVSVVRDRYSVGMALEDFISISWPIWLGAQLLAIGISAYPPVRDGYFETIEGTVQSGETVTLTSRRGLRNSQSDLRIETDDGVAEVGVDGRSPCVRGATFRKPAFSYAYQCGEHSVDGTPYSFFAASGGFMALLLFSVLLKIGA